MSEPKRAATRRLDAGALISIGVHAIAIAALAQITFGSHTLFSTIDRGKEPVVERIGFLALPDRADTPGRRGGDGRPITREAAVEPPPLVAPVTTPAELPPIAPAAARREESGRGPLMGGGGPLRGIQPAYRDPRIWAPAADVVVAPKSVRERVDSSIAAVVEQHLDSIAAIPVSREPGDWTFERGGKKYGIDQKYIRLGDVSIPTAVLGLLPLNVQANPIALDREKRFAMMRADIDFHAQRALNEEEFRAAIRRIRERKERERREQPARGPILPDSRPR